MFILVTIEVKNCLLVVLCEVFVKKKRKRKKESSRPVTGLWPPLADTRLSIGQIFVLYAKKVTAPPAGLPFTTQHPAIT